MYCRAVVYGNKLIPDVILLQLNKGQPLTTASACQLTVTAVMSYGIGGRGFPTGSSGLPQQLLVSNTFVVELSCRLPSGRTWTSPHRIMSM